MSPGSNRVAIVEGGIAALETVFALRAMADGAELMASRPEADYRPLSVEAEL